jgi:flagellar biosynthetic protein FliQ
MTPDRIVTLARSTLETTLWLGAPVLIVAIVVGLVISILQVMTAIQDMSLSTVPRLLAVGLTTFVMMPWFIKKLSYFAVQLLSDFHPYIR